MKQKVLFVCSANVLRSPTAEEVFRGDADLEVSSAGTDEDAECPVSEEIVEWADTIVVMEHHHRRKLEERFPEEMRGKEVVVLNISDNYERMDPVLVRKLRESAPKWKWSLEK